MLLFNNIRVRELINILHHLRAIMLLTTRKHSPVVLYAELVEIASTSKQPTPNAECKTGDSAGSVDRR
jgi:hypothetical protein